MEIGNKTWPYSSAQCCFCCNSAWFLLFVCPVCTKEWEGRRQNREGMGRAVAHFNLSTAREVVWAQRTEVFYCQNEEGKHHGTAGLWLERRCNTSQQYHLHLSLLCHTPFLPIYSPAAIGNHLKTRDWNELPLFKFRNTQISPPACRLALLHLMCCITDQVAY